MMATNMRWDEFAGAAFRWLINPEKGKPILIVAVTSADPGLAQELLVAGIRYGADSQLITYERKAWGKELYLDQLLERQFSPVSTFEISRAAG